jgi:hypothetical protein
MIVIDLPIIFIITDLSDDFTLEIELTATDAEHPNGKNIKQSYDIDLDGELLDFRTLYHKYAMIIESENKYEEAGFKECYE